MKKIIARIALCFLMIYTVAALEVTVPEFNFGILAGKPGKPDDSSTKFTVVQESSINFRLLHGERFYSDLNLALHIPDILHFFDPDQLARIPGEFTLIDFSLNFPNFVGRPMILSIFTGQHQSIIGTRYSFDFLKQGIRPIRMYEHDVAALFTPPHPREGLGVSFAGLILNVGYAGGSFSWNGGLKDKQEYSIYAQGGIFSPIALTNANFSFHITDKATKVSFATAASVLFTINDTVNIFTQLGLHKTDFRSATLKQDIIGNIFAFFEPRIALDDADLDFTFFISKVRDTQSGSVFPTAPLVQSFASAPNELYGGLNLFFSYGKMEFDKMQGGFHALFALPITRRTSISVTALALTPFYTLRIGPCDLDFRFSCYPLLYATPASMFEGKIALKRSL